jgi:hypothetical protein
LNDLEQRILDKVRDSLGADRLESAIVYLDHKHKRAGECLHVADVMIHLPWDGHVAFVDLEPKANWGHACSYFAIRLDGEEVIELPAQMPPFLKAEASNFGLLWRGALAPEWAVAGISSSAGPV